MVFYLPRVKSFMPYKGFRVGDFFCTVGMDCENLPHLQIQYLHLMYVYEPRNNVPIFATACETNRVIAEKLAAGEDVPATYAFGIFPNNDTRHITVSWSDEWAEIDKFTAKSLEVVREHFEVVDEPIEIPMQRAPQRVIVHPDA